MYVITPVPVAIPTTVPDAEPIGASTVLLLLHEPPPVASVNVVDSPTHKLRLPEIGAGEGLTVSVVVALQPVASAYVIVVVPPTPPTVVIVPVAEPMVATPVLLLLHVPPPPVASVNVTLPPKHNVVAPEIATGDGLTVTTTLVVQFVVNVYKMVDVPPVPRPVTVPDEEPTVATPVLLLLQVPPPITSESEILRPEHTANVLDTIGETGFTVTTTVTGVQFVLV